MENTIKSFAGCTPSNVIDWKEKFDVEYNDDGQLILVSKEVYKHDGEEDYPDFEYKFAIRCWDLPRFGSDNNSISMELFMVVLPKYWCKEKIQDILNCNGLDNVEDIWFSDLIEYGVRFGDEYISYDTEQYEDGFYDVLDNKEVVEMLNVCASVYECMNSLRGFSLDRSWNMIGTTGWDILGEVLNGQDMIQSTLSRYGY